MFHLNTKRLNMKPETIGASEWMLDVQLWISRWAIECFSYTN